MYIVESVREKTIRIEAEDGHMETLLREAIPSAKENDVLSYENGWKILQDETFERKKKMEDKLSKLLNK